MQAGPDTVEVPIGRIRKVTAKRLTESQAVPHYFLTNVVDVERLVAFRKEINEALAASGVKVSINDLIVRGVALALRQHPDVNASWGGDKICATAASISVSPSPLMQACWYRLWPMPTANR